MRLEANGNIWVIGIIVGVLEACRKVSAAPAQMSIASSHRLRGSTPESDMKCSTSRQEGSIMSGKCLTATRCSRRGRVKVEKPAAPHREW